MAADHIVYWLTRSLPPTRLAHPSTIGHQFLLEIVVGKGASVEDEIAKVFALTPEFVVFTDDLWFLEESSKTVFHDLLGRHYVLATEIVERQIYRLKPSADTLLPPPPR